MIAFVRGRVAQIDLTSAVVEVGGVGLQVMCTPRTLADLRLGQEATLPTSMVVREDSLTLFGFADEDEKQIFELLQTASGVGPKLAQAMLAVHAPDELRRAVATDDVKTLTSGPRHRPEGRPADHPRAQGPDRLPGRHADLAWQAPRRPLPPPGASQVQAGLVGPRLVGQGGRPGRRPPSTAHAETMPEPDVARLLRLALQTLSKA